MRSVPQARVTCGIRLAQGSLASAGAPIERAIVTASSPTRFFVVIAILLASGRDQPVAQEIAGAAGCRNLGRAHIACYDWYEQREIDAARGIQHQSGPDTSLWDIVCTLPSSLSAGSA